MAANRLFIPQTSVDEWLSEHGAQIESDFLILPKEQRRFQLKTAVRFISEVTGEQDNNQLVGRVKDLDQIKEIGAEHSHDSVILGDNAYEVVEGFVAMPSKQPRSDQSTEIRLLSKFFLSGS